MALVIAVICLPALFGRWRLARFCAALLIAACIALWLATLAGAPWLLPLPTRQRAVLIALPIMAFWPALAVRLITRYRLTPDASAERH